MYICIVDIRAKKSPKLSRAQKEIQRVETCFFCFPKLLFNTFLSKLKKSIPERCLMYDHAKIDSFKLTITLSQDTPENIAELHRSLSRYLITIDRETGDIESQALKRSCRLSNDSGITTLEVSQALQRNGKHRNQAITLKISSKLLKARYYEGISIDTITDILSYLNEVLQSQAMPLLTMDNLLDSKITDVDICRDAVLTQAERKTLCTVLARMIEPSSLHGHGYKYFYAEKKRLSGCQLMTREAATLKKPFIKTYDKSLDAESRKHGVFFSHYEIETQKGLQRLEITLKDYKHLESHNVGNTLRDLLKLSSKQLDAIISKTVKTYDSPVTSKITNKGAYMTNLDIVLEYLILQAHNQNKSGHAEINNLVRFVESIDTESRAVKKHKAKIESRAFQVLQNLTNGNESINSTELSNSFIESFLYKGL